MSWIGKIFDRSKNVHMKFVLALRGYIIFWQCFVTVYFKQWKYKPVCHSEINLLDSLYFHQCQDLKFHSRQALVFCRPRAKWQETRLVFLVQASIKDRVSCVEMPWGPSGSAIRMWLRCVRDSAKPAAGYQPASGGM